MAAADEGHPHEFFESLDIAFIDHLENSAHGLLHQHLPEERGSMGRRKELDHRLHRRRQGANGQVHPGKKTDERSDNC